VGSRRGDDLSRLLDLWRSRQAKRATGGWWSLAGFSYQAAVFLASFFRAVEERGIEPGRVAEMESISDIVCPADNRLRLIQVKRTLDVRALRAFLQEAYVVTQLCRDDLPELLPHLCLQVACRTRTTRLDPADVPMEDVVAGGDEACWLQMLTCIDSTHPVLEERDPLDELHAVFWNVGIRDTMALVERLLGRLLSAFLVNEPEQMRSLGRDLWSLYAAAERHDSWRAAGKILIPSEVNAEAVAAARTVRAGETPQLEHLRKGLFRDRPAALAAARRTFDDWFAAVEMRELTSQVPVFWISGRSGEGKSVLLLQLTAALLRANTSPVILYAARSEVEDLLLLASRYPPPIGSAGPMLVVVDDVYDIADRDSWEQSVRDACSVSTPPFCFLTCGPTEQMEQFCSRLVEAFDVTSFELQPLSVGEFDEFVAWFEKRTGRSLPADSLTRDNALLVQLIFELTHGERLPEFARRFQRRLKRSEVFELARTIVAATALYLDAPVAIVADWRMRDALERLCNDDQLHFRIAEHEGGGVRLAHPHLAWLLFQEWVEPPETLEKALARELHKIIEARVAEGVASVPFAPIHVLIGSTHLGTAGLNGRVTVAARVDVIRELYRLHLATYGGVDNRALPRWLELESKVAGLVLTPTPLSFAVAALNGAQAHSLHASIAGWVWVLSEGVMHAQKEYQEIARRFLFAYLDAPGLVVTLTRIVAQSQDRNHANSLAREWLDANTSHPQAYHLLARLVAVNPTDASLKQLAISWLDANRSNPLSHQVVAPLLAANPSDNDVRTRAAEWLNANTYHPHAYQVLAPIVAANPSDDDVLLSATQWLDANRSHPKAFWLLAAVIAAHPSNGDVLRRAIAWLDSNPSHYQAYWLLATLVAAHRGVEDVLLRATEWLDANPTHTNRYKLLETLVAANPSDGAVRLRATEWLDANRSHAQARELLKTLVAASPSDPDVRLRATTWLDENPSDRQPIELLKALVAANPEDEETRRRATQWLDQNSSHPSAHELLRTLLAANPGDSNLMSRAKSMMESNSTAPAARVAILQTLITRSDGAAEWMARGVAYVQQEGAFGREQIVAVLVSGGKAAQQYIDLALDFVANVATGKQRLFILIALSRTLVGNPAAAATYLRASDKARQNTVRHSIAHAITRRGASSRALTCLEVLTAEVPEHVGRILLNAVELDRDQGDLDTFMLQWLDHSFRTASYWQIVNTIRRRSSLAARLHEHPDSPPRVALDLSAASGSEQRSRG
jgi:thioredoxin-like negative regulator of GroEL